ncbi:Cof-type HAD-IIB family hydrolase [Macrococcus lamae]|nr:Cof-type HAD-IIB family hydrolase [Macrococcus lamae]
MTQTIKLIALDCDGTLINDERKITPRTKEALMKAQQQGIRLALVSGRPRTGFWYESAELELAKHHGILAAYNGGLIIDAETQEVMHEQPIDKEAVKQFFRDIEPFNLVHVIDNGSQLFSNNIDNEYVVRESTAHQMELIHHDRLMDALDFSPAKIILIDQPERLDAVEEDIFRLCEGRLAPARTAPFFIEITLNGVNKSTALDHICEAAGIHKSECMSFGDNMNDIEMVKDAGIGVAMGNARVEVKAVADIVTASNNVDGIADVVEQYI